MTRAGFAGPPPRLAASPYAVARKIFRGIRDAPPGRQRRALADGVRRALHKRCPQLTDAILRRAPQIVGGKALPAASASAAGPAPAPDANYASPRTAPALGPANSERTLDGASDTLESALSEQQNRMRKLNLSMAFVRGMLAPGSELDLGDVALRWAGMPNKNERGLTREVLEALAHAHYLEPLAPDRYRVVRSAEHAGIGDG